MKKYALWLSMVFMIFFITGCVKADFHVTMNKDGSADLDHKFAVDSDFAALAQKEDFVQQFKQQFESNGFKTTTYKDGKYIGVEGTKHVDNIEGLKENQLLGFEGGKNPPHTELLVDKGLLFNTYHLKANFDMNSFKPDNSDAKQFEQMFLNQMDMKFSLTLPVEAQSNNASRVIGDSAKTYQWDLIPGQNNEITLQCRVLNLTNLIALCAGILVVLLAIGFYFYKRKTNQGISKTE